MGQRTGAHCSGCHSPPHPPQQAGTVDSRGPGEAPQLAQGLGSLWSRAAVLRGPGVQKGPGGPIGPQKWSVYAHECASRLLVCAVSVLAGMGGVRGWAEGVWVSVQADPRTGTCVCVLLCGTWSGRSPAHLLPEAPSPLWLPVAQGLWGWGADRGVFVPGCRARFCPPGPAARGRSACGGRHL